MFGKLRHRLALLFTFLLMIFLFVFIGITYFTFSYSLYHDRYNQVMTLVRNELGDHPELYRPIEGSDKGLGEAKNEGYALQGEDGKERDTEDHGSDDQTESLPNTGKRSVTNHEELRLINGDDIQITAPRDSFYYLFSKEGVFLHGDETKHELRFATIQKLQGWVPNDKEYRIFELDRKDENRLYYLVAGRVVEKSGERLGVVYAGVDVTTEKNALDRLMLLLAVLSLLFLLLSYGLGQFMAARAMRPIRKSYERQREFVADASHELRTPISVIQASLDVIESEEKERLSPFSQQVLQDVKEETRRMGRLTQDLLTLARADSGALQIIKSSFDLAEMGRQVVRTLRPMAGKKGIQLSYEGPDSYPFYADAERIRQLITILLDNGIKYTPDGGKVNLLIREEGRGGRRKLLIEVKDTGIGIPAEQLPRIFDRFYRVDKARSREEGGTGLGLSIAKWIVKAHEGEIHAASKIGEGSTFTAILPVIDGKEAK